MPSYTSKFKIGDKVSFNDGTETRAIGILTSLRVKDEQGRYGFHIQHGKNDYFIYSPYIESVPSKYGL